MDASQLLHADIFDLLRQSLHGGKSQSLDTWFARFDDMPPDQAAAELSQRLADDLARESSPATRHALLTAYTAAAEKILPALEQLVDQAALPLADASRKTALLGDSLIKTLANASVKLLLELREGATDGASAEIADRSIRLLARRQLFEFRANATPSAGSWKALHDAYRRALARGLAGDAAITPEYLAALVFALAEPAKLPRLQLKFVHAFLRGAISLVGIGPLNGPPADPMGQFLVVAGDSRPGRAFSRLVDGKPLPSDGLQLDCHALVERLDRIAAGEEAAPIAATTAQSLRDTLSGVASRRFSRTQFHPRAELIAGLQPIMALLSGKSLGRRQADSAPHELSGNAACSEWSIINESPDGFGVRHCSGDAPVLDLGDLVVLRPRDQAKVFICLVRRSSGSTRERLELGLQLLCSNAAVIALPSEDIRAMGQQGILLPHLPAFGNAAGLIAAAGAVGPNSVITENQAGALKYYRLGARIDSSSRISFHLLQAA